MTGVLLGAGPVAELAAEYEQARHVGDGARQRVARRRLLAMIGTCGDYRQPGREAHRLLGELRDRDWAAEHRPDLLAGWRDAATSAAQAAARDPGCAACSGVGGRAVSKSRGVPLHLSSADVARWRASTLQTATCTLWMAGVGRDGYGRFALWSPDGRQRTVTPHQVAAVLAHGELAAGATLLHDCDVRLCVETARAGHVRVGTQTENMRQAARRGRARGPHPGLVDVRGNAAVSRAIQAALRQAADRSPEGLARVLADTLAAGHPLRDNLTLFSA